MKHILDIMKDDAKKIVDLDQIKMLREIIEPTFKEIIEHTEKMYLNLENKIYNEIIVKEQNDEIVTTILHKDDLNYHSIYFTPIIPQEKDEERFKNVLKNLKEGNVVVLEKIFIPEESKKIEEIILRNQEFVGYICSDSEKCKVKVKLELSREYLDREKIMYEIFCKNNHKWRSINNPYVRKMVDIVVTKISGDIDLIDEISHFEYELEDIEYKRDLVPVWNIFEDIKKVSSGIDPADDRINYVYNFQLKDMNLENSVILPFAEKGEIKATYRKENKEFKIICDTDENIDWRFFIIRNIENLKNDESEFSTFSNNKNSSFNYFKSKNNTTIRTKAEIARIAYHYGEEYGLILEEVYPQEYMENQSQGYDINYFIRDEIRTGEISKYLIMKFKAKEKDYLTIDIMSFIVAEIQLEMVDFKCIGVLL